MLDHAFMEALAVMRRSFQDSMLDSSFSDERLQVDILLGDLSWEQGYCLPGEERPPRVRADVTLEWPTWSQTAARTWMLDGELDEPPEVNIEVVFRVQMLASPPDLLAMRDVLDADGPPLGGEQLRRANPMVEQGIDRDLGVRDWAVEFPYDGTYEVTEDVLDDLSKLGPALGGIGPWVASALVRLGDLRLAFVAREEVDE